MDCIAIGITSLGKKLSIRPIYLWKAFPLGGSPLGKLIP